MSNNSELIRVSKSSSLLKQIMDNYFIKLKEAENTRYKKIAWCSSVGPVELLYSMGFEVYFPENHAAMIGASKTASHYIPNAVSTGYSSDICSYLTSDIGSFIKNKTPLEKYGFEAIPRPDVLVFNTNQCREVEDWFMFYGRHFNVPVMGIHTPLNINEVSDSVINYISNQFKELINPLENISGQKFLIDDYSSSVAMSHEACKLWRKVLETGKNLPSPINFFDAAIHMAPIVVMRGTETPIQYYTTLLSELNQRITEGISAVPKEEYRIYWDGMPMWFALSSLAKTFARHGVSIVASTYCNSWVFDLLDSNNPFESSARAYSELFIVRNEMTKESILKRLFLDFSIDGIIYHNSKTCCRNSNNMYGMPLRLMEATQIPYIELFADLNDSRMYNEENTMISIETFVNQLKSRKH